MMSQDVACPGLILKMFRSKQSHTRKPLRTGVHLTGGSTMLGAMVGWVCLKLGGASRWANSSGEEML